MENIIKRHNGITYSTVPVENTGFNCGKCAATCLDDLCDALVDEDCSLFYVFKATDSTIEKLSEPKVAPSASEAVGMKFDDGKPQYSLVPPYALAELAKCLTFGAKKYAPDNWKRVSNPKVRYLDAALRHIELVRQGEDYDKESGSHHYTCAMANLAFLVEFEKNPELNKGGNK